MYSVSDVVEMGKAHQLVQLLHKELFMWDDFWPNTDFIEDTFDE